MLAQPLSFCAQIKTFFRNYSLIGNHPPPLDTFKKFFGQPYLGLSTLKPQTDRIQRTFSNHSIKDDKI